jgi:hypothetical protein
MIQAITIEREFGCGASEIAAKLAELLGWKLWDHELTQEIARLTNSKPKLGRRITAMWRMLKCTLSTAVTSGSTRLRMKLRKL